MITSHSLFKFLFFYCLHYYTRHYIIIIIPKMPNMRVKKPTYQCPSHSFEILIKIFIIIIIKYPHFFAIKFSIFYLIMIIFEINLKIQNYLNKTSYSDNITITKFSYYCNFYWLIKFGMDFLNELIFISILNF